MILVTHDRYFLDQVAEQLLAFPLVGSNTRALTMFSDFSQWEEWIRDQARSIRTPARTKEVAAPPKKVKLTFKDQNELNRMEETIHEAEEALKRMAREISLPENASNAQKLSDLSGRMAETQTRIDALYDRWAELEKKQEAVT